MTVNCKPFPATAGQTTPAGRYRPVVIALCCLLAGPFAMAADADRQRLSVYGQEHADLSVWQSKSFQGHTRYDVLLEDGRRIIRARSEQSASALYRELPVDLRQTPWLNWSWRVDKLLPVTDPTAKSGDDYAVRVYVVVRYGLLPWQTRALNYVWANRTTDEDYWLNPYTDKAAMIPLQSGSARSGEWTTERVNVLADYRRIFNADIERIDGVAIMTDSDDSGASAVGYYADMYFSD